MVNYFLSQEYNRMDYIRARTKFVNEKDEDFDRESTIRHNERLWDEWEIQIRKDEQKKVYNSIMKDIYKEFPGLKLNGVSPFTDEHKT